MKVKYFAWVRERVGMAEETVEPPASVHTVDDLIGWLGLAPYAHTAKGSLKAPARKWRWPARWCTSHG